MYLAGIDDLGSTPVDDQTEAPIDGQTEPKTGLRECSSTDQDDGYFSGPLEVDTVSLQRTGNNLLVVVDGEEFVLPGGKSSVMVDDHGRARVDVFATFRASDIDITSSDAETGS